jgi:translation initiation factor IF-3
MIRIPQVRVIDEEGNQLGVLPTFEALRLAQERGYDLVEVAPTASPPVCRLLDFGQYKYELTKREKEAKRKQRAVSFKEIRIRPKIGDGDFETKVRRAIEFLEEGDRIKVTVQFRGRELTHPHLGRDLLAKFADDVKDHGVLERAPLLEGKQMHITIASTHKPKVREGVAASSVAAEGGSPEGGPTGPERPDQGTSPIAGSVPPVEAGPAPAAPAVSTDQAGSAPAPSRE